MSYRTSVSGGMGSVVGPEYMARLFSAERRILSQLLHRLPRGEALAVLRPAEFPHSDEVCPSYSPLRRWLWRQHHLTTLPLSGAQVPLRRIFTLPTFYLLPPDWDTPLPFHVPHDSTHLPPPASLNPAGRCQPTRWSVRELLGESRILVVGGPGSGKTMLCQYLALELASHQPGPIPTIIRVRDLRLTEPVAPADIPQWLGDTVMEQARMPEDFRPALDEAIKAGNLLLLLDGLDEIAPGSAPAWWALLQHLFNSPPGRVLATTRSRVLIPPAVNQALVLSLCPQDTYRYVQLSRSLLGRDAEEFLAAAESLPELEISLGNPLQTLGMITSWQLSRDRSTFSRRATLLRRLVWGLVERWCEETHADMDNVREVISILAGRALGRGRFGLTLAEVTPLWRRFELPGDVVFGLQHLGLFEWDQNGRLGFLSPPLLEVVCAERLIQHGNILLTLAAESPWPNQWTEVLTLAAGLLGDPAIGQQADITPAALLESLRGGPETVISTRLLLSGRLLRELGDLPLGDELRPWRRRIDVELCALVRDERNLMAFGSAVCRACGPLAARELTKGLKRADRDYHLYVLGLLPDPPREVVERSLALLRDDDPDVRASVIDFLALRRVLLTRSWHRVLVHLQDEAAIVRESATYLLSAMPEIPEEVRRAVALLQDDADPHVARAALELRDRLALKGGRPWQIPVDHPQGWAIAEKPVTPWPGPDSQVEPDVEILIQGLDHPSATVRAEAVRRLGELPLCPERIELS